MTTELHSNSRLDDLGHVMTEKTSRFQDDGDVPHACTVRVSSINPDTLTAVSQLSVGTLLSCLNDITAGAHGTVHHQFAFKY